MASHNPRPSYSSPYYSPSIASWRDRSSSGSDRPQRSPSPPSPLNLQGRRSSPGFGSASHNWRDCPSPDAVRSRTPRYEDVEVGTVFFLSFSPPPDSIIHEKPLGEGEKPWEHPAVITDKYTRDGKQCVKIRLCTSFNGRKLEEHKKREHWRYHILADNDTDAVPREGSSLAKMAPGSGRFHKRTYINISPDAEYPIEFIHLSPWTSRQSLRFDYVSTQRIINCEER